MIRVAVIGSGPAGTWCARALVARGIKPVILDAGERLDAPRQAVVDRVAAASPSSWNADDLEVLTANPTVHDRAVPRKLAFGSDFVYGADRGHSPLDAPAHGAAPTYALGGYSTVWGGAMLPISETDMDAWPFARAALEPHYRAVLSRVPLTGAHDALEPAFPLFGEPNTLRAPVQGTALLGDLAAATRQLSAMGVVAGRARLAVQTEPHASACIHCGLCLSGCPTGAIYWTGHDIEAMTRSGAVEYRRAVVFSVREAGDGVEVEFVNPGSNAREATRYDQVFLAAGPINTTRILLQSRRDQGDTATLLDSQKFVAPLLRWRSDPSALRAEGNVLAAGFVEINDPAVSRHWVHVQVSPMNRLLLHRFGVNRSAMRAALFRTLLSRLMLCLGSLHSDDSARIRITLEGGADHPRLVLRGVPAPTTAMVARRATAKVATAARAFGAWVPPIAPRMVEVGASAHIGGSFPMQATPAHAFASDSLGRPTGARRIFIADASAFPSIPGTTVALTVMANAHRVGTHAPLD